MTELLIAGLLVIGGVAWREALEWAPWLARKILERAIPFLPEVRRERMSEEWSAELQAIPGKLSPLVFACHLWWGLALKGAKTSLGSQLAKLTLRALDIGICVVLLGFFLPLLVFVPILWWSNPTKKWLVSMERIGQDGQIINVYSFALPRKHGGEFTVVGRFLHDCGLDTLPALVNVLKRELSLVGPPPRCTCCFHGEALSHKPGLLWATNVDKELLEQFGKSLGGSLALYVGVLAANFQALIYFPRARQ